MGIALLAKLRCAPGKRDEVLNKILPITAIALREPEPLTLLIFFASPPESGGSPSVLPGEEDMIYFLERFESSETRRSGTPESTPAFYGLLSEMMAADPPLLVGKPEIDTMRDQCVRFRIGMEDHGSAARETVFVSVVKRTFEAEGAEEGGQEDKGVEEVEALVGGADGYLFGGAWIGDSETSTRWRLDCWESQSDCLRWWGNSEKEGTEAATTVEERLSLLAETGYIRKRIDGSGPGGGTTKFLHDVQIVYSEWKET